MPYDYDLITIGLGPAGMAISVMGSNMGLKVCGIEANKIGGECMNVGCIPSKSLLQMAKTRATFDHLEKMGLQQATKPDAHDPFPRIARHIDYINEQKTMSMFDKVDLKLGQGKASFVDDHTVAVGNQRFSAKRIFICAGTRPALPPIQGLAESEPLTNETIFDLDHIPDSMIVLGSGAIACEMAQAFARLGTRVTMVMRGTGPLYKEDADACDLLHKVFTEEGVDMRCERSIQRVDRRDGRYQVHTEEDGQPIEADYLLSATGRRYELESMKLSNAGVAFNPDRGIKVNRYLQTSRSHIYACGDCNGYAQLSHAAMHQGMIGLINSMMPWPMKRDFRRFIVPWTVFTDPPLSFAGRNARQLKEAGVKFETITIRYEDYGAAIAEGFDRGFVRVFVSPAGRIHGAYIIGEGSGEMINEWSLAIQKRIRMHDIMLLQHSFPSMSFLNKRAAETWMMNRMQNATLRNLAARMFRLMPG
jgi:pyruvate/2-oxoglutarate dehydrogenase complex dihydrolipoamide dehydrogenase (E3) component